VALVFVMDFKEVLDDYRERILKILELLKDFLEEGDVNLLQSAARLLINAGSETYGSFMACNHAILAAMSLEAGARLNERVLEIRKRGLRGVDVEYVLDIYSLFKTIADAIGSGQYEEGYKVMMEKRGASRRAR